MIWTLGGQPVATLGVGQLHEVGGNFIAPEGDVFLFHAIDAVGQHNHVILVRPEAHQRGRGAGAGAPFTAGGQSPPS